VFDCLGNLQISYDNININSALTIETIDMKGNNLNDGVYFVKAYIDNEVSINKMIIKK